MVRVMLLLTQIPRLTVHVRVLPSAMERVWSAPTAIFTSSVRVMLSVMLMVEAVVLSSALFSAVVSETLTSVGGPSPSCAHVPTDVSIMMLRSSKPRRRLAALVLLVKNLFMLYLY